MDKMTISLSQTDLQSVVNALTLRPYGEVARILADIMRQVGEQQQTTLPPQTNGSAETQSLNGPSN